MSPLEFVEPADTPQSVNVLLYGPPGTGKSVAACSAPGPVLVLNAEGPGALWFARKAFGAAKIREVRFEGSRTLDDAYRHLRSGEGGEQTVVVDSLGEVYDKLARDYAGTAARPSLQNYGDVNSKIDGFIRSVRDLDVNVVLIAHEQIDDESGEITRRPATGGKKLPEKVMAQMDVVAYTGVAEDDEHGRRYMGQLVEANGRRAKDRSGALGAARELDLSEWIETIAAQMSPAPEPITKADAERLYKGAETASLSHEQINAWFTAHAMEHEDAPEYPEVKSKTAAIKALRLLTPESAGEFEDYVSETIERAETAADQAREASQEAAAEREAA